MTMYRFEKMEGRRCIIAAFGFGTGYVATGATWEEVKAKADEWETAILAKLGLRGRLGILEQELSRLCDALKSS